MIDQAQPLDPGEVQRILEDVHEVVLHQQRLVFVHRQADVALARLEHQIDAAAFEAAAREQRIHVIEQPQTRIGQVDRIDRVLRNRNLHGRPRHDPLVVVAEDHGRAPPGGDVARPVEIDEVHRRSRLRPVRHAISEARAEVGQVRVARCAARCPSGPRSTRCAAPCGRGEYSAPCGNTSPNDPMNFERLSRSCRSRADRLCSR